MDVHEEAESPVAKKRRIPKACSSCRKSKVRCDEQRPSCARCVNSGLECSYVERPRDPTSERLERIETAIFGIQERLNLFPGQPSPVATFSSVSYEDDVASTSRSTRPRRPSSYGVASFTLRELSTIDVVTAGTVSEDNARLWFATFFQGCDRFVPVFSAVLDDYESVRMRSGILFDVMISYGCRAAMGVMSKQYQRLYTLIRRHTSDLVLKLSVGDGSMASMEDIQALLIIASFSDSGAILLDVALTSAIRAGFPARLDGLFASLLEGTNDAMRDHTSLYVSRVWYGLFVLDQILSLDGGKSPSVCIQSSPRRVRALIAHPERTATDLRLLAQVELNVLRSSSYISIVNAAQSASHDANAMSSTITGSLLDLKIWLSEWEAIVYNDSSLTNEHPIMLLNLRIQHAWAVLTLHLRALTASGVENIALMTDRQRQIAFAAKVAAEQHLQLLLTNVPMPGQMPTIPYVANLKYAMEFVWAKNAFCVLIVLRLGLLLGDTPMTILQRLAEARTFLHELEKVGMGAHISYMRILSQTVKRCERAVRAGLEVDHNERTPTESGDADFQGFIPQEFMFSWDFPGLNLCYIPFDWQDLFLDFGTTA